MTKSGPNILVVDDNKDLAKGVALILSGLSTNIRVAHDAESALEHLGQTPADVLLTDVKMPGMDGHTLLKKVLELWPQTRVIVFTGYGTIESAVEAMKEGAYHYLTKPFNNDELVLVVKRALKERETETELMAAKAELDGRYTFCGIHSRHPQMLALFETIRCIADSKASVLIYGESGTGKELVARAIHKSSGRANGPFIAFNAASVPESLAEAELFGAKKGAYTGADRDRQGLFEEAHGGTIFIDEAASMALPLQAKLLRVLQEHEVQPLGTARPVPVDVRVISAVNEEPARLLAEGRLRRDLYYRLAVVRLHIPPLRERVEDIPLLVSQFLEHLPRKVSVPARVMRMLVSHDWPGNVRELQNVLERASLLATDGELRQQHVMFEDDAPTFSRDTSSNLSYEEAKAQVIDQFQRKYVERLLGDVNGNLSEAARRADLTRAALYRIMKKLGMEN